MKWTSFSEKTLIPRQRRAVSEVRVSDSTWHLTLCTRLSHAMKRYAELNVKLNSFRTLVQLLHASDQPKFRHFTPSIHQKIILCEFQV